ncbi:MAG: hydroxymethylbilane synthase [Dehalococcoidia bacterium]|jgi:hydroxymethylbilane synthase|nr:hydroxymethylbilane synthase [Dehalococcoidia bacterium]
MSTLRIASRASRLALVQVELVTAALQAAHADLQVEVVEIHTEGDQDRQTPLRVLGGRGVFVKGVEDALLDGRADVAVHSLKDVPSEPVPGLTIAAIPERADPRDVLVASGDRTLAQLPAGARVGTSSQRRVALLNALRPDLEAIEIRGNVDTRIQKVMDGEADAVLLAASGLDRLGRLSEATQLFRAMEFLPAPGQGALGVQCRSDDDDTLRLLAALDHAETRAAVTAERGLLAALGTGCSLPVGAYATVTGDLLTLRGMLSQDDQALPDFGDATGPLADAEEIGGELGRRLQARVGAEED